MPFSLSTSIPHTGMLSVRKFVFSPILMSQGIIALRPSFVGHDTRPSTSPPNPDVSQASTVSETPFSYRLVPSLPSPSSLSFPTSMNMRTFSSLTRPSLTSNNNM